jgi:hypothetical protein
MKIATSTPIIAMGYMQLLCIEVGWFGKFSGPKAIYWFVARTSYIRFSVTTELYIYNVTITCYLRRPEDADKGQLPLAGRNLG